MGQRKRKRDSVPPLVNLRRILDAHGYTRAQLTARTGLTPPTVRRAIKGEEPLRRQTAEKVARAVGVPVGTLYSELAPDELASQARYPTITAGRSYTYPEMRMPAEDVGGTAAAEDRAPKPGGGKRKRTGEREYVILHRDDFDLLRGELRRIGARLDGVEEAVSELATRPIAEFKVTLKERGRE